MDKIQVRAAEGAKVLHPVTGRAITHDEKGEAVPHTTHVARRIAEGSLLLVAVVPPPAPAKKTTTENTATGAR